MVMLNQSQKSLRLSSSLLPGQSSSKNVNPVVCLYQNNQAMSINFNPGLTLPGLVQSSPSSTTQKLIAFPSNSAYSLISPLSSPSPSSSSSSGFQPVISQEDKEKRLKSLKDGLMIKQSLPSNYSSHGLQSQVNYLPINNNGINKEWCRAHRRQLDEMFTRLNHLRKVTQEDLEYIEAMKEKTIKLIGTYSSIIIKTNQFLSQWDRKYKSLAKSVSTNSDSSDSDDCDNDYLY